MDVGEVAEGVFESIGFVAEICNSCDVVGHAVFVGFNFL